MTWQTSGTADDGATPAVLTDSHCSAGAVVFFTNGAAQNRQLLSADRIRGWGKTAGNALGVRQDVARP